MTYEEVLADRGLTEVSIREKVREELSIPLLLKAELGDDFTPTEEEIVEFYNENKQKFAIKESVKARHILIKVEKGASAEVRKAKEAELKAIRKKLLAGGDFGKIAKAKSECTESGPNGGDLGRFGRGRTPKAFEDAAFGQKPMEIGEIVKTDLGYHIVQVLEHDKGGLKPLAEVRETVVKGVERKKRSIATQDYLAKLQKAAKIEYPGAGAAGGANGLFSTKPPASQNRPK